MASMLIVRGASILSSNAQVIVCPTNSVGAMGAGLAKTFRDSIPGLFHHYKKWCVSHDYEDMIPFAYEVEGLQTIYCLHTKKHWVNSSELDYVQKGLDGLALYCSEKGITSVAIPPLGCGKGSLEWEDVYPLIRSFFKKTGIDVEVYLIQKQTKKIR